MRRKLNTKKVNTSKQSLLASHLINVVNEKDKKETNNNNFWRLTWLLVSHIVQTRKIMIAIVCVCLLFWSKFTQTSTWKKITLICRKNRCLLSRQKKNHLQDTKLSSKELVIQNSRTSTCKQPLNKWRTWKSETLLSDQVPKEAIS